MKIVQNLTDVLSPVVVLVRPQLSENMGMTARAMMNCELGHLRIVEPRESPTSDKAVSAASGAGEILKQARVFDSLQQAIDDMHFVLATTARAREMVKPVYHPDAAASELNKRSTVGQRCAILFGPERTGLENDDLAMADGFIHIPLNPKHMSLNLSQAVLLLGYEWHKARENASRAEIKTPEQRHFCQDIPLKQERGYCRLETSDAVPATKKEVDHFLTELENELASRSYFRWPDKDDRMKRNLRDIFTRNDLTDAEVRTLHRVLKVLAGKK